MKREVKIGIFAVAMILLAWGGIRFLSGLDVFSRNVTYLAAYEQVNGVQEASAVMVRGVKVGSVAKIELNPQCGKVVLHLNVRSSYQIPNDSEARIYSDGLLGGKAVELIYGHSSVMLEEGDTIRSSHDRDLMAVAGSELEFFKQRFSVLADDLTRLLGNLNQIMETNAANLESSLQNVESITDDVAELLDSEKQNLARAVESLSEFSTMLGENTERVDSLLGGVNHLVLTLEEQQFAEQLSSAVGRLDTLLKELNEGEGTLGQLLHDEAMYGNLTEASANLAALLADLKANPARYVHLSVFGKDAAKSEAQAAKRAAKEQEKAAKKQAKVAKKEAKAAKKAAKTADK